MNPTWPAEAPSETAVCPRFETNVGVMTRPSIPICRLWLDAGVAQAPPSILMTLWSPMLQLGYDWVSSSLLAVCLIPAAAPVALTYSQYVVLGCSVASTGVVNVISWKCSVIAEDVLRLYSAVSPGRPALSSRMETCGVRVPDPRSWIRYNWMLVMW